METAVRRGSGNITAWLVAVALLELVVNRLFGRLFSQGAPLSSGGSSLRPGHIVGASGPFLFQLTAILALGLLVVALSGLVRRGELYQARSIRFSVAVIAAVFSAFAAYAVVRGQIPARHFLFLESGFAFLALLTALALAGTPAPIRMRIGVMLFALPGVMRAFALFTSGRGPGGGQAAALAATGEVALLLAATMAPFSLPPRPWRERAWRLPLVVATILTTAFVIALAVRFDLVQATVLYGLRLELPHPGSVAGFAHVAAFFGWTYATVQLIAEGGGTRLAGYGLLLLAMGGYETGSPVELTLSLLGLLALAVGELRAAPLADGTHPRVSPEAWRSFVGRLCTAANDGTGPDDTRPEAVVVADGHREISRLTCYRRGYPVSLRLLRSREALVELELTVGTVGRDLPDASVERHRRWLARSPETRLAKERMKTGDADFDAKFSVHGHAPLDDEDLRRRFARQQGDGVVTLWKGSAARYLLIHPSNLSEAPLAFAGVVDGAAPVDTLVALLDTLADLIEASMPAPDVG